MKKQVLNFYNYLKENDNIQIEKEDKYVTFKDAVKEMINNTIKESDKFKTKKDFIKDYLNDDTEQTIIGFVENSDIFDFYLKYQVDIDDYLNNELDYFSEPPEQNNVFSLYDYIINGTKYAVDEFLSELL